MTAEFKRTSRVAQMVQRKLAQIIQLEVKDPRLPRFVTVADVEISSDLSHARVYITVLDKETEKQSLTIEILNNAASYLRTALARSIKLRNVPQLHFVYDYSIEYGSRLQQLIDDAYPGENEVDSE